MTFLDPVTVLLALGLVLLAVASTLALLVRRHPPVAHGLYLALSVAFAALIGLLFVDLAGAWSTPVVTDETRALSLLAATHRRLLIILPILLILTSQWIVSVYGLRLAETHARPYRNVVFFSASFALICVIVVAIEAML